VISCEPVHAVPLLRTSVTTAQYRLLAAEECDMECVNRTLATLLLDLAPVLGHLKATAATHPGSPLATVLAHLGDAFNHASVCRPEATVSSLIAAAGATFLVRNDTPARRVHARAG
jgi:hypothetical protein